MADIITLAPPQRNMKGAVLTIDDVLDMGKEADLEQVLVIGRTKSGELYYRGAKLGIWQQSRKEIRELCQDVIDKITFATVMHGDESARLYAIARTHLEIACAMAVKAVSRDNS